MSASVKALVKVRVPTYSIRLRKGPSLWLPIGVILDAADAAKVAQHVLRDAAVENLIAIMLDGRGNVTAVSTISVGGVHHASVIAADILRVVLARHATAFVLAHNHPSGDPTPSLADVTLTAAVRKAAESVGLHMHDHVVLGHRGSWSRVPEGRSR